MIFDRMIFKKEIFTRRGAESTEKNRICLPCSADYWSTICLQTSCNK